MSVSFGIYLGNTSCCIAVHKDAKLEVVANAAGDRVTPAVVTFHEAEIVAGLPAKQGIIRFGPSTVQNVLRLVGVSENDGCWSPSLCCSPSWVNGEPVFSVQRGERSVQVTLHQVLVNIFSLLKDIAGTHSAGGDLPAVITVPAWGTSETLKVVRKASESSGFTVLSTITQPAAAILNAGLLDDNKDNIIVVTLHCGGTTVVGAVGEAAGGMVALREVITSRSVAGDKLTDLLVQYLAKEFYSKYKGDPLENKRSKRKLYNAAENAKHVLSTMASAQIYVESLWEGVDFSTTLSRARFEGLVISTLLEFLQPAKDAVHKSKLSLDQIQKVVLTGGSSKIPKLQQFVGELFTCADIICGVAPDEDLAAGAAMEAAVLLGRPEVSSNPDDTLPLVPALSTSIYCYIVETNQQECVFSRGTPTHSRQSVNFTITSKAIPICSLVIYEAVKSTTHPLTEEILAKINLTNLMPDSKNLKLDFHLKSDGSLHVSLVELESKINKQFVVDAERS